MAEQATPGGRGQQQPPAGASILAPKDDAAVQVPRQAQALYDKAVQAVERVNYDYAITLLLSVLEIVPDFVKARHLLRETEMRRFDSKKSPAFLRNFLATLRHLPTYISGDLALASGKCSKALETYEKILRSKPRSIHALRKHARAAQEMRMLEVAINSLSHAQRIKPGNLKVTRELARVHMQNGDVPEAQQCFQRLVAANNNDKEALKALQDLAAMGTIIKGDWEDTESYRGKIKDEEFARTAERETRLVKTEDDVEALIRDRERKIAEEPEKVDHYKSLADLYLQKKDFDKAVRVLDQAIKLAPADSDLPTVRFRTVMKRFDSQIEDAQKQSDESPDNQEFRDKVEQLKKDKDDYALRDMQARVARYPTNLDLRLELGELLMKMEMLDDAIKELQVAKSSSKKRTVALNALGECFRLKGQPDMAVEQFEKAFSELYVMDSFKKEVMYNLGRAYEDLGEEEKALQQYKQIYAEDIGFRDVNERVRKAYRPQRAAEPGSTPSSGE